MKTLTIAAAALAVGAVLGYVGRGRMQEEAAPKRAPYPVTNISPRTTVAVPELRPEVRDLVPPERPASPVAEGAAVAVPPSPESVAAHDRAHELVMASLSSHRWTREQGMQLRALMPRMNDKQRKELLAEIIPAINRQEIKLDSFGPLF